MRLLLTVVYIAILGICAVPQSFGRGIRTDFGTGTTPAACDLGGVSVQQQIVPIGSLANSFDPNVGISVTTECYSTDMNQPDSVGNLYQNAYMFLWGSHSGGSPSGVLTQVMDYTLQSADTDANGVSLGGFSEIEFNYASSSCGTNLAVFTLGGFRYSTPCSNTNNYSLLFDDGSLVGSLDNSNVETMGLGNSGWTRMAVTAPEPDPLTLFVCVAIPLVLFHLRGLGRASRRPAHIT